MTNLFTLFQVSLRGVWQPWGNFRPHNNTHLLDFSWDNKWIFQADNFDKMSAKKMRKRSEKWGLKSWPENQSCIKIIYKIYVFFSVGFLFGFSAPTRYFERLFLYCYGPRLQGSQAKRKQKWCCHIFSCSQENCNQGEIKSEIGLATFTQCDLSTFYVPNATKTHEQRTASFRHLILWALVIELIGDKIQENSSHFSPCQQTLSSYRGGENCNFKGAKTEADDDEEEVFW